MSPLKRIVALACVLVVVLAASVAQAQASGTKACVGAFARTQVSRDEGKLLAARKSASPHLEKLPSGTIAAERGRAGTAWHAIKESRTAIVQNAKAHATLAAIKEQKEQRARRERREHQ